MADTLTQVDKQHREHALAATRVPSDAALRARKFSLEQRWEPITREISGVGTITHIPANLAFAQYFNGTAFGDRGFTGASSDLFRTIFADFPVRLVNLWYSNFELHDKSGIEYLRSGTFSRPGEPDSEVRAAISFGAAEDLRLAVQTLVAHRVIRGAPLPGAATLTSIDLQSPNSHVDEILIEQQSTVEHAVALTGLDGRSLAIGESQVPMKVRSFSLPTHEGDFLRKQGWTLSPQTVAGVRAIISRAVEAQTNLGDLLSPIANESYDLLLKESFGTSTPAERYALAARVVFFSALAGDVVHFNCRSGKDRTGMLDAEVKFLVYQVSRRRLGLRVSGPGQPVLDDESDAWREILLKSGNLEIQKLNSGNEGSKVSYGCMRERIGKKLWRRFLGDEQKSRV